MLLCGLGCSLVALIGALFPITLLFMAAVFIAITILLIIKKAKIQFVIVTIMILMTVGSTVYSLSVVSRQSQFYGLESECEFTVKEIQYEGSSFYSAKVEVLKSKDLEKGTKISVNYNDGRLKIGDVARARIVLSEIDDEYKEDYYSKNIFLKAKVYNLEIIKGKENKLLKFVGKIRDYIKKTAFDNLSYNEASTLCALIFGEKGYFTKEFSNNVSAAGVSHVMVVSGMHLTIFMVLIMSVINKFSKNRYISAFVQVFAVLAISCICGFTSSILRAGVMYIIMSIGLMIKRKTVAENVLGAACSFILILTPFVIFDVAFQLSVLSTFGILAVALPTIKYLKENQLIKNSFLSFITEMILISASATILTLPVAINCFGFVSSVGIITTLIITYPVTFCIWISIIALVIGILFKGLAGVILIPCEYLLKFTNYVINKMGSLPFSVIYTSKIWCFISIGIIILIFCGLLACKKRLDMIKLNEIREKIKNKGGGKLKWQ